MMILRVDMTNQKISKEELPDQYRGLGGRALSAAIISSEVPSDCDPLGTENRLIFAPGYLTGTTLVNTGRLSIGAKSPLTGGIKESNVGGTMAYALARHGIRAVIVEGAAPVAAAFLLRVPADASVALVPAAEYKGMRNYALAEKLLAEFGSKNSISLIGPAGEMCLSSASIQTTDTKGHPSRSAGRGGLGAVMGAKGLKALVVSKEGKSTREVADQAAFKEMAKPFAAAIKNDGWSGRVLPEFGTASIVANTNAQGALPTLNATRGSFDGADKISGETMAQTIRSRGGGKTTFKGCSQCVIDCSNVYVDEAGSPITSALEYETIWAMGAMIGNDDLDAVARLDFLCDDIGVDTMNTGTALAVAMDAGYTSFGDAAGAIEMVAQIASGTELGRVLGNGPVAVGRHFGHPRVPVVKGQSIAGYDPRAMPGMGVTYATSPMGADHTAGFVGADSSTPTTALVQASQSAQVHMAALDSMGVCLFAQSGGLERLFGAIAAIRGEPFGHQDWEDIGSQCLAAERQFNRRAGLTREDDRLPQMFSNEDLPPHHRSVSLSDKELDGTLAPFG